MEHENLENFKKIHIFSRFFFEKGFTFKKFYVIIEMKYKGGEGSLCKQKIIYKKAG